MCRRRFTRPAAAGFIRAVRLRSIRVVPKKRRNCGGSLRIITRRVTWPGEARRLNPLAIRADDEIVLRFNLPIRFHEEPVSYAGLQRFGAHAFRFEAHAANVAAVVEA